MRNKKNGSPKKNENEPFFPSEVNYFANVMDISWKQIFFRIVFYYFLFITVTIVFLNYVLYNALHIPVEMPLIIPENQSRGGLLSFNTNQERIKFGRGI